MINKRKMHILAFLLGISIIVPTYSKTSEPRSEDGPTCGPGKFACDNFRCIPAGWVCDMSPDCVDRTDELESNCPTGVTLKPITCKSTQFKCDNGFCLPIKWKCDGTDDCGDGSDEKTDLCNYKCQDGEFMCGDGQCITTKWKCDGHEDCTDGADEKNCTTVQSSISVVKSFKCTEGYSIPVRWRCDGDIDCRDGSDEQDCAAYLAAMDEAGSTTPVSTLDRYRTTCREGEFRCPGSYCILQSWLCDGIGDCRNSEDELNCTSEFTCKKDEFKCADNKGCIKKSVVCDGIYHCLDQSDEADCPQDKAKANVTISSTNTTTTTAATNPAQLDEAPKVPAAGQKKKVSCNNETDFICNDGKCISRSKLCNGESDCRDREDESVKQCGINECERNNGGCMQKCVNTKDGHYCTCANGYILVGRYSCSDVNECVEVPGICSQHCINTEGSFHCSCLPGYTRDPANYTRCKAAEGEAYLLFSHSYDIRSLRLRDRDMTSVVQHTRSAIALDYVFDTGKILWSDKKDKKIYRASMADTDNREVLVSDEDISADGLAVDWVHSHVYYTDTEKSAVRLLSWDAKYVKTLISEKLGHPRAIVVSPQNGYIYWTDWGTNPKIERAALDGSGRMAIVSHPHVVWPNGLTIDHSTEKIFWCDGRLRTISSADLDGSNVEVILYSPVFLRQPFSISVFEDRLYWTDWSQVALFSADKFTGSNIQNVSAGHLLESPKVVHVYHQYRQPKAENICNQHSCSHFCLRSPVGIAFCACADGYVLGEDSLACIEGEIVRQEQAVAINLTDRSDSANDASVMAVKHKLTFSGDIEASSQTGFIIGGIIGVMFGAAVFVGIYLGWTRYRPRPIQRIRFHNPVYRKTTADDLDGRGYIIDQDQPFFNPSSSLSKDYPSEPPVTDDDDAPLAPKGTDDIV